MNRRGVIRIYLPRAKIKISPLSCFKCQEILVLRIFFLHNRLNVLMMVVDVMEKFLQVRMFKNGINVINKLFSIVEQCSAIDIVVDIHEHAYKFLLWLKMLIMLILPSQHHQFVGKTYN